MSKEPKEKKINAVFEGGGVKGIGLVGAIAATEEAGYTFANVGGTSAGAIVASLIAAGYNAAELKQIMDALDYTDFQDKNTIANIPIIGTTRSIRKKYGQYLGQFFEHWLRELLLARGVRTFGDLISDPEATDPCQRYKLQVIASDISQGRLLILPGDIQKFGINPDDFEVATAVRMSMSLPFFFEPVCLEDLSGEVHFIVDGGLLSNYPVWLFDPQNNNKTLPTFGYQLIESAQKPLHEITSSVTFGLAMALTMMEAHDQHSIRQINFNRTIEIPTLGVGTTEFELTRERSDMLYQSGLKAGRAFFNRRDSEEHLHTHHTTEKGT